MQAMTRPIFAWTGLLCIALAFGLVVLGLWTFFFEAVEGQVEHMEPRKTLASGSYPGIPFARRSSATYVDGVHVVYRYRVDGRDYHGTRIGMGLWPWSLSPFSKMQWEQRAAAGWPVIVYHAPGRPRIAVLHRGIDPVVTLALLLAGFGLLKFSAWMRRTALNSGVTE